jgi:glutamate--cysteine ligase
MTVQHSHTAVAEEPLTAASARQILYENALRDGPIQHIGLELEGHLVDLRTPIRRVGWDRIHQLDVGPLPGGSDITFEPGGQVELSAPPRPGIRAAVDDMSADVTVLRAALRESGLGIARIGADPARPAARVNPGPRYAAMETHFAALGQIRTGAAMMCSTAALQINLDAGPAIGWADRVRLAHRLGPVLIALSACSPLLAGRFTGWRSARQRVWSGLDPFRCGPLNVGPDPRADWADYAMRAPVMLVRTESGADPVRGSVPFSAWAADRIRLGDRRPTAADLQYHATTLFPPVRLRGFIELRYLDAVPARWWPALAAITVALLDHVPDAAAEAVESVAGMWRTAARDGLSDPQIRRAAALCIAAAGPVVPTGLAGEVAAYADLVDAGQDLAGQLAARARRAGPLAVLEEEAHA